MAKRFTRCYFSLLCTVLLYSVLSINSYAQESGRRFVTMQTDSILFAENESLVALTLVLDNQSDSPFIGKISLSTIAGINLLGKDNAIVNMEANSKIYYPIRLSVSKDVPAGESLIKINLLESLNQIQAQFTSKLIIQSKRKVQLINNRPNEIMQHIGDSLSVSVLLSNQGNSHELITLTASFPDLMGGKNLLQKKIQLEAFKDSVVVFKKIITKELLKIEQYAINIAALYGNGEFINNVIVSVQNVSGNRSYIDPNNQGYGFDSFGSNKISLNGSNLFSYNEAIQLSGRGIFQMPVGSLDFNLNASQYTQYNNRPLITNTYLNYELKNKGITVGSISESLETFVNGRGIKAYTKNEDETKLVELALVDKNYNLLGDQFLNGVDNGYTAYAKTYLKGYHGGSYTGSLLYDRSAYEGSENMIFMNRYQYQSENNVQLGFDLGGGLTRLYGHSTSSYKPSIAIGNTLNGTFGKYSIYSNNFYSTDYYPGIRRGVVQLNERVSRNIRNTNTWVAYNFYNYTPQYLNERFGNFGNFSNSRVEGGASFFVASRLSLSLSMNKIYEKGQWRLQSTAGEQILEMNSYRLTEAFNWRSKNNLHTIYLSSENGFSKSPITGKNELDLRTNASWTFGFFSLSGYFQQGNFSVSEVLSNSLQGENKVYRFSISPSLRKDFFNTKLKVQLNMNYNRDSFIGKNWMYSGMADYAFSRSMSAFVNTYFYTYQSSFYNSSSSAIQAGVSYNLPDGKNVSPKKKGRIEVFTFYDNNTNGIFDEGDLPAEGRVVIIGGISFISQRNGRIEYKKVPYGDYTLRIPSQNWYAEVPSQIVLKNRDFIINVPLQKTGKITGKFYYEYDERTSMEVSEKYGGLRLMVQGKNNFKSQALTNANGEFTLFLPIGEYEFWVDENSLPKNVYTELKSTQIKVLEGNPLVIPEIKLNVKQRVVEVKRFTSD